MQSLLVLETGRDNPNAEVRGLSCYVDGKERIGGRWYPTVLAALADGWRLLGPPQRTDDAEGWDWWLAKESA